MTSNLEPAYRSRPSGAPAYFLGRPASVWMAATKRGGRSAADQLGTHPKRWPASGFVPKPRLPGPSTRPARAKAARPEPAGPASIRRGHAGVEARTVTLVLGPSSHRR